MKKLFKKKHISISLVIIFVLAAGFAAASFFADFEGGQAAEIPNQLVGEVVDAACGVGVGNVTVVATPIDSGFTTFTNTTVDGIFFFADLVPGTYTISTDMVNYASDSAGPCVMSSAGEVYTLNADNNTCAIDGTLTPLRITYTGGGNSPACGNCADADGDGVCDSTDNCPAVPNPSQEDYQPELKVEGPTGSGENIGSTVEIFDDMALTSGSGNDGQGKVYFYTFSGGQWSSLQSFSPTAFSSQSTEVCGPNGTGFCEAFANFGADIEMQETLAIVGSPNEEVGKGAAYIYRFNPATGFWAQEKKLFADVRVENDYFGANVDIAGDWAAVGSPRWGDSTVSYTGAVYLFKRESGNWVQKAKLIAPDGKRVYGYSLHLSSDSNLLAVSSKFNSAGTAGDSSIYVYRRSGDIWNLEKILDNDSYVPVGEDFAGSIQIDSSKLLVGAAYEGDVGYIYYFSNSGNDWNLVNKFTDPDFSDGNLLFGGFFKVEGNRMVVGMLGDTRGGLPDIIGATYIFDLNGSSWNRTYKTTPAGVQARDSYGTDLDIGNGRIISGAPNTFVPVPGEEYLVSAGAFYTLGNGIGDACEGAVCGNGVVESGELCDDGNTNDSDECTNSCVVNGNYVGKNVDWLIVDIK